MNIIYRFNVFGRNSLVNEETDYELDNRGLIPVADRITFFATTYIQTLGPPNLISNDWQAFFR